MTAAQGWSDQFSAKSRPDYTNSAPISTQEPPRFSVSWGGTCRRNSPRDLGFSAYTAWGRRPVAALRGIRRARSRARTPRPFPYHIDKEVDEWPMAHYRVSTPSRSRRDFSRCAVMIVIPVAKQPNAVLNSSESTRASQVAARGYLTNGGWVVNELEIGRPRPCLIRRAGFHNLLRDRLARARPRNRRATRRVYPP